MGTMNKEFEYKGHRFNIKVKLNTEVERRPNGKIWHTVTINDMGLGNFYQSIDVEDYDLVREITRLEVMAIASVDNTKRDRSPNPILYDLGFR